jgi:hypothetical protein
MARRRSEPVKELVTVDDAATELLPLVPEQGTGAVVVQRGVSEVIEGHGRLPAERPEDILAEPPDARDISAELAAPPRRKLPWLTLLLSAGIVAAGAFIGGVYTEKHHADSSASNPFAALAGARRGGSGTGAGRGFGFGGTGTGAGSAAGTGAGGAAGGLTFGTVKLVDGGTIYLTDAQGNTVKVTTSGSTKVTESEDGKVSDLKPGQTVTVRGSRDSSGDVAASTVTEGGTAPSSGDGGGGFGGGFSGGFGRGGAGGAGGTAGGTGAGGGN